LSHFLKRFGKIKGNGNISSLYVEEYFCFFFYEMNLIYAKKRFEIQLIESNSKQEAT